MSINIRSFVSPGFEQNGYVVWRDGHTDCVVIDPGSNVHGLQQVLAAESLNVVAILLTHAHLDHIEGVAPLVRSTAAPIYLHPADTMLYQYAPQQALAFGVRLDAPPPPTHTLEHGQALSLAAITFEVRHVPGHAPGHVMFIPEGAGWAIVGDVIFQGSIGRTDLPGGDFSELITSIRTHVFSLPDDTVLHTGHGPSTTVGHERATNPFLIPQYGGGLA